MASLSATTTEAAERYGHYRLVRVIGRGGMAIVHAAVNERTGAEVALKVVHGGAYSEEATARFEHEASIAGKLEHRNIVRVYDFVKDDTGASVLVMEHLRGETLADLLARREKLSLVEALAIVLPLLAALEHTHRQGIVHRDVKPSNVFLAKGHDGEVVPKLLDFGIATRPELSPQLTADDEVLGTPRAMSPEQIRGDAVLDGRSDLFSVASLMVEMLTGEAPFAAKTAAASLVAVLERDVNPAPEMPPRVFVELARALRKRPNERHASTAEFAMALRDSTPTALHELDGALRGLSPEDATAVDLTQVTSPVERRRRPRRTRPLGPLVAGLVLVLVTVTAFVVGSQFGGRSEPTASASASVPAPSAPAVLASSASPVETALNATPPTAPTASALPTPTVSASTPSVSAKNALSSAAPRGSARTKPTKPVATRPDF